MDIKKYLKEENIKLSDFATSLQISRPTLDSYILQYEKGEVISKDKYESIFKALFDGERLSKKAFENKLKSFSLMLNRDNTLGVMDLSPDETDMVLHIIDAAVEDVRAGGCSKDVYNFIEILIRNYHREDLFRILSEYFVALNSDCEISEDQIKYFANFYKMMRYVKDNPEQYDASDYEKFLSRREECKKERQEYNQKLKSAIAEMADKIIEDAQKNGIELSEEELIKALKDRR